MKPTLLPCQSAMSPAESRYTRRLMVAMVLYVALLFGSILGLKSFAAEWPIAARALMALLPVLPIALVGKIFIDYLGECDEMIRRIELEAVSLSSLIVGLLFLAALGGGTVAIWVFPLLCGIYGLTKWLAIRRYR
ncbi:hypothetical protein [Arenimonas sp. GDDSR-1]|uniref:hypothetical protein n=1 Tax=Arenimonas sp. GDDSR-1 TaxID=2950125 RepID=UPI002607218E|nr:hypothetical protein [Arenimonas sp. GDDSR-1]